MSDSILNIGFSPCPNDIYIFHAWLEGKIQSKIKLNPYLADIQELNLLALKKQLPVIKVSFACLGQILDDYILLPSGAALGWGCGPKIISRFPHTLDDLPSLSVAIPGEHTSAHLLFNLLAPPAAKKVFCSYEQVAEKVQSGEVDAGLIIHETRFTFEDMGLKEIADLGSLWEASYDCPVPLGGIAVRRDLDSELIEEITRSIQQSLAYANEDPSACEEYMLRTSIEKNAKVCRSHIELYVNQESLNLSEQAITGIETLLNEGSRTGLLPQQKNSWLFTAQEVFA